MAPTNGHLHDVRVVESLADVRDGWSALAERSGNVFATPDWAEAWVPPFAPRAALRPLACHDASGALRAVWPLYVDRRGPVRVLRLIGHGPADELGPACAPEDRVA